jgi:hypothetical protein
MATTKAAAAKTADAPVREALPEFTRESNLVPQEEMDQLKSLARAEKFSDANLREVQTFEQAFALAEEAWGEVIDISKELGNGFMLVTDKSVLIDVPFVILSFAFNEGTWGTFTSVAVVTKDNRKFIFNDGSTGVCEQLVELAREHKRFGGYLVQGGLSQSTYATCVECGRSKSAAAVACPHCGDESEKRGNASTYYLSLTPAA